MCDKQYKLNTERKIICYHSIDEANLLSAILNSTNYSNRARMRSYYSAQPGPTQDFINSLHSVRTPAIHFLAKENVCYKDTSKVDRILVTAFTKVPKVNLVSIKNPKDLIRVSLIFLGWCLKSYLVIFTQNTNWKPSHLKYETL